MSVLSRQEPLNAHRELIDLAELNVPRTRGLVFPDNDGSENGDILQMRQWEWDRNDGVIHEPRGRESDCSTCRGFSLRSSHRRAAHMKEQDAVYGSCCGEEHARGHTLGTVSVQRAPLSLCDDTLRVEES